MPNTEQDKASNKTWKLFTAAILFALLAGLGTMFYLKFLENRLKERLTPPPKAMIQVVVASKDLPTGSTVNTSTMSIREVPKTYVNSDIFTPDQFNSIQGAILIKPMQQGKMLAQDYIDLKIPKDFSGTIQAGHRAITIQVDEINSISGMIKPGNSIDLFTRMSIGTSRSSSSGSEEAVVPVLEDVLVLATDKISARANEDEFKHLSLDDRKRTYNTLTLEVTPKDAALIAIAESRGELITMLRNTNDTGGILFSKVTLADLLSHSGELLESAISKQHNRNIDGIHRNQQGQLVTRDGIVIKDPNVHLNKNGLLVTDNGTVLSGRDLMVGKDGRIRSKNGKLIDTASLIPGKNGTLVDKSGNVLDSNGYTATKGGFLVDKDGNIVTPDGNIISGLTLGKDGQVRTRNGRIVTADQLSVGKDGTVRLKGMPIATMKIDKDDNLRTADGTLVKAQDLVTVGSDGVVRTKDGQILPGVHVGKDGKLYDANGKEMSSADILAATTGFKENKDGTVTESTGKTYTAKDLVTVGKDGTVRTKDGKILKGVYVGKDGKLYNADGKEMSGADIVAAAAGFKENKDGTVTDSKGKTYTAKDLVTIDKDGTVRTKDGKILKGVYVGKDGKLYNADGKKMSGADILAAAAGFKENKDGTVTDSIGKTYTAKDLVTVSKDGTVRTKDGKILKGVYVDQEGKLRNKDGSLLTAQDIISRSAIARAAANKGVLLKGLVAKHDPGFAEKIRKRSQKQLDTFIPYEVEYIVGGSSDGPAKTFKVQIDTRKAQPQGTMKN